jgi:hypothetical protein
MDKIKTFNPVIPYYRMIDNTLKFFNDWEKSIIDSVLYMASKNLIIQETRDDINSSGAGFLSLCTLMLGKGNSIFVSNCIKCTRN